MYRVTNDPRVVALPRRLLTKKPLLERCLVTGARERVAARLVNVRYVPWWVYPTMVYGFGLLAYILITRRERLWLPLSDSAWRTTRLAWLLWAPLHVISMIAGVAGSIAIATALPEDLRVTTAIALWLTVPLIGGYAVHHAWLAPRAVLLDEGPDDLYLLLRLPDAAVAHDLREAVERDLGRGPSL